MPKRIQKPQLSGGPRQRLIEELFVLYGEAGRPTNAALADKIKNDNAAEETEGRGTASAELIRRTLKAQTVPNWYNMETIFLALADLAGINPHSEKWIDDGRDSLARGNYWKMLWNEAMDEPWPPTERDPWQLSDPPF